MIIGTGANWEAKLLCTIWRGLTPFSGQINIRGGKPMILVTFTKKRLSDQACTTVMDFVLLDKRESLFWRRKSKQLDLALAGLDPRWHGDTRRPPHGSVVGVEQQRVLLQALFGNLFLVLDGLAWTTGVRYLESLIRRCVDGRDYLPFTMM